MSKVVSAKTGKVVDDSQQASFEEAREKIADEEAAKIADADEILNLVSPSDELQVVEKQIEVSGQKRVFNVKKLSYSECARVDSKKYKRAANGQIVRDTAFEEVNGVAHQIHAAIVSDENAGKTDADGKPMAPNWVPLFTLDQIMGKTGLMARPNAKMFIYQLCEIIWDVVPELNPLLAAQAANQLGMA